MVLVISCSGKTDDGKRCNTPATFYFYDEIWQCGYCPLHKHQAQKPKKRDRDVSQNFDMNIDAPPKKRRYIR